MERKARLLLKKADCLDGMAASCLNQELHSRLKGRTAIANVHFDGVRKLQRRAAALRKQAAQLAATYFEIQPIAEAVGEHKAASQAAMA